MRNRDLGLFVPPNLGEMGADATELEAAGRGEEGRG
jgi:hypothetical protein